MVLTAISLIAVYAFSNIKKVDFEIDHADGIQFYKGSWEDALKLAKKEDKLIFLDIYATWCGPCKKMKNSTFSDSQVGAYFNTHFINVALDAEKAIGAELKNKFKLRSYPSLLILTNEGDIIHKTEGYRNSSQLLKVAEKYSIKN